MMLRYFIRPFACPRIKLARGLSFSKEVPLIVEPEGYSHLLGSVVPLDVSWHMPNASRDSRAEFKKRRIPRARFMSLDEVAGEHPLSLPHMMPSPSLFATTCKRLGISPGTHVVLYDTIGVFSSPRALFMFKAFGHKKVSIMNGGMPNWEYASLPVDERVFEPVDYPEPELSTNWLRNYEDMKVNATAAPSESNNHELVLDARAAPRFHGTAPEPRPGLPSGHIPYSISLPFDILLETVTTGNGSQFTRLRNTKELYEIIARAIGSDAPLQPGSKVRIVNTCGSGMTAAIIWLALQRLGVNSALYDESWMGYAARPESIIATTT
ncbi:uncharacterized protein EI90DRAFT_2974671 [Cantharellus anzutake]|uniref:uncharacterized protein n=1 Tax=Cantharellus anzutake TaxID=1750568 RepID=UPI0019062AF8|nr:uncharacterized protein EI90DRAFT_2974671 [Cantharellus anzutake]KAF8328195.1 hypothetical protein EI90DRAFT_2974671 [Cantharellus anzutake]